MQLKTKCCSIFQLHKNLIVVKQYFFIAIILVDQGRSSNMINIGIILNYYPTLTTNIPKKMKNPVRVVDPNPVRPFWVKFAMISTLGRSWPAISYTLSGYAMGVFLSMGISAPPQSGWAGLLYHPS